jgi:Fic family protein
MPNFSDKLRFIESLRHRIEAYGVLSEELLRKIEYKFRLECNYNSNKIEGGTLTKPETRSVMIGNITVQGKPLKDIREMKGHDEVMKDIFRIGRQERNLSEKRIREIHRRIIAAESPEEEQAIGHWKKSGNHVINYRGEKFEFTAPPDVPEAMHSLLNRLNANLDKIHRGDPKAPHPLLLAFEFHLQYLTIHPFMDGNGRTARLLTNLLLASLGYPPFWILESGEKEQYNRYLADVQCYGGSPDLLYAFLAGLVERSLQLTLDALEGKEIEDMNDWKKELRQLKSALPDTDHFTRSKSREAINDVFLNSVQPALLKLMQEFREFEDLFISLQPFFGGDGRLLPLSVQNTLEKNYEAQNVNSVFEFNYNLNGFKKSEKPFDIPIRLKWRLHEYAYDFTMAPIPQFDRYELPYDRYYDERIMQQIVQDCAEFVLNEIKKRQKNGR